MLVDSLLPACYCRYPAAEDILDPATGKVTRRYGAEMACIEGEQI
jgi:hypothetical protein